MIILGIDTATPATAVALAPRLRPVREARDDVERRGAPAPHRSALLELAAALLAGPGSLGQIELVAVGVGPGGYTGCASGSRPRAGSRARAGRAWPASARCARSPSRWASAPPSTVLDARRGEAFVAAFAAARSCSRRASARRPSSPRWAAAAARRRWPSATGRYDFVSFLEAGGIAVAPARERAPPGQRGGDLPAGRAPGTVTAPVPDYQRVADAERAMTRR